MVLSADALFLVNGESCLDPESPSQAALGKLAVSFPLVRLVDLFSFR